MSREPTPSQRAAIKARGNVLVAAGAGTGKTHTLVARALGLVFEEGCDLDRILMVTFTDAAAAEMRQRLREELQKRLEVPASAERAAEQLALLDTAPIGTLHSFCLQLVRQHFHDLKAVDPQVRVLDVSQTRPLAAATLETVLDRHYAGTDAAAERVREFIQRECRGVDEQARALILRIHRYTQTQPDPERWMEQQLQELNEPEPVLWRDWLMKAFQDWRTCWLPRLREAQSTQPCYGAFADALVVVPAVPDPSQIVGALTAIRAANQTKGGVWPTGQVGKLRPPFKPFFDDAAELEAFLPTSDGSDPLVVDWKHLRGPMTTLLQLVAEFTAEFSRAKRDLGGVDFADLEQFALQLLRKSEIAVRWQERFKHVFVDEYQDINAAQDSILCAVSGEGEKANRFLVGDVKQSIYRFRLADPRIFQHYERAWRGDAGRCLQLSDNFRSREAVLVFVNALFDKLMQPVLGGMSYSKETHLQFGRGVTHPELARATGPAATPQVEFHLIQKAASEPASDDSNTKSGAENDGNQDDAGDAAAAQAEVLDLEKTEKEARLVARRLQQIREEKRQVWDGKGLKTVDWGDMVVLMRAVGAKGETYAKVFHEFNIPLEARRGGFYEALEVMDLLNVLRLLDNPLQDVPLLAVLRSSLVGLSFDALAEIRACRPKGSCWQTLRQFHREAKDSTVWPKVDEFLSNHARWRASVRRGSLSACLESVLDETGYEALLLAGERGVERAANVRRLLDLARRFDPYQRQGLHRFLRFVDEQLDLEEDRQPLPAETANAVRLKTIHQSKGCEFPVVVLADLGRKFNEQDLRESILMSDEFGLCMKVLPTGGELRSASLPFWLASRREKTELRAEELRLLYVALTRARDTLLLVGTDDQQPKVDKDGVLQTEELDDVSLARRSSYLGWFKLWLPELLSAQVGLAPRDGRNDLLSWSLYTADDTRLAPPSVPRADLSAAGAAALDVAALEALEKRFSWRYAHDTATRTPAKTSVTTLRRRMEEEDDEALQKFRPTSFSFRKGTVPSGELSATEVGTAHHTFLQLVALEKADDEEALRAEAARLRAAGVLSAVEERALDLPALARFWGSDVGQLIRAEQKSVRRELPFTARFSPAELAALGLMKGEMGTDEFVVVQGVADLAVVLPEEIWLLDFKTDRMKAEMVEEKRAHYAPQLKLYAAALEKIYNRPVRRRWLHFFDVGETTPV